MKWLYSRFSTCLKIKKKLTHEWYTIEGNVSVSLVSVRVVPDKPNELGSAYGYNVIKCQLIKAHKLFSELKVELIGGRRVLASVIGSDKRCNN